MTTSLRREPTAVLPPIMSLVAVAIVIGHYAMYGIVHETDEGTPAHLWQMLMGLQVPIIAFFALKWLPTAPRQALMVLGLQILLALASFASVYFLTG